MRKTLALLVALPLAACQSTAGPPPVDVAMEAKSRQILAQAMRSCTESGYRTGTQHYADCVRAYANKEVLMWGLMQQAAAPAPVAVVPSSPIYRPPSEIIVTMPPRTCTTTGMFTNCY